MNTKTVSFSYGSVKNASLKIPAEAYSAMDAAKLIRESYFDYAFRPGCGLMSDECLTSSIGQANFYAGALGGYETRVSPEAFNAIRGCLASELSQAVAVAAYREPNAGRMAHLLRASKNDAISEDNRRFLLLMAKAESEPATA